MMRGFGLVVGIAAAAVGLWVMVSFQTGEPPPTGMALEDAGGLDAKLTSSATDTDDTMVALETEVDRTAVPPGVVPVPTQALVRVQVTRKENGAPVPGAEVSYVGTFSTVGFSGAEKKEYAELIADTERLLRRYGGTVVADRDGLVLLSLRESGRVVGRSGPLYGELYIRRESGDEERVYELELERDVTLEIRAVDSRGVPAVGVPVSAVAGSEVTRLGKTQAPLGSLRIVHAQTRLQDPAGYLFRPEILGLSEDGVPYHPGDPPAPIVLHLPVTGSVIVRQTGVGGEALPVELLAAVTLATRREPPQAEQKELGQPQADGTACFDWVVAGQDYLATSHPGGHPVEQVVRGPVAEGEEVWVTLGLSRSPCYVVGRAVDEQLQPLRGATLVLDRGDGARTRELQTDEAGRFRLFLSMGEAGVTLQRLTIKEQASGMQRSGFGRIYAWRGSRLLVPGDNDLGDVILGRGSLVASGQILVNGAAPGGKRVSLRLLAARPAPPQIGPGLLWSADPDLELEVLEGGRFEIRGEPRYERYMVESRSVGYLPMEPVEFVPGDQDLLVELDTGGSLVAQILVDESIPLKGLEVRLIALDGQDRDVSVGLPGNVFRFSPSNAAGTGIRPLPAAFEDGRHTFGWRSLWPGRYRFELMSRGASRPLVTVPDVQVQRGENRDPRLEGIDLRGRILELRIAVVDGNRRPIPTDEGMPVVLVNDPGREVLQGFAVTDGLATVVASKPVVDLLVVARGYMPKEVRAHSDMEVMLEPCPEVVLRITAGAGQLGNHRFLVSLERREGDARGNRRAESDHGFAALRDWIEPAARPRMVANGEVSLPVSGDGKYAVRVALQRPGRAVVVDGLEPGEIELRAGTGRVFEIRIPEAALRRAVEQAGGR